MKKEKSSQIRLNNFVKALGLNYKQEIFIVNGIVTPKEKIIKPDMFFTIDSKDCIVAPGFIDPQINGIDSFSFWEMPLTFSEIDEIRLRLAYCGVVGFCPTIITAPKEKIVQSIDHLNSYIRQSKPNSGARILGIHIEGIFITKYGVHDSRYSIKELTSKNVEPFIKGNVAIFTLAPELDKTGEAIKLLQKNNILVSIGHSNATYSEGVKAVKNYNLKTVTHMFNSLRGINDFSHRGDNDSSLQILKSKLEDEKKIDPINDGIMLALLKEKNVLCMAIADGIHVNKEVLKLLRNYKDVDHFSLASDMVSNNFFNTAKLTNKLGGGQTTLDRCVSNLINWDVSNIEDSLICASKPIANYLKSAKDIGLGEITFGNEANIVLWDTKKNCVKGTIIGENVFLNY